MSGETRGILARVCKQLDSIPGPLPEQLWSTDTPDEVAQTMLEECTDYDHQNELFERCSLQSHERFELYDKLRTLRWKMTHFPDTPEPIITHLPCPYKFFAHATDGCLYMVGDNGFCKYDPHVEMLTHREFAPRFPFYVSRRDRVVITGFAVIFTLDHRREEPLERLVIVTADGVLIKYALDMETCISYENTYANCTIPPVMIAFSDLTDTLIMSRPEAGRPYQRNDRVQAMPPVDVLFVRGKWTIQYEYRHGVVVSLIQPLSPDTRTISPREVLGDYDTRITCIHALVRKELRWVFLGTSYGELITWNPVHHGDASHCHVRSVQVIESGWSDLSALSSSPSGNTLCGVSSQICVSIFRARQSDDDPHTDVYRMVRILDIHRTFVSVPSTGMPVGEQTVLVDDDKVIFYETHSKPHLRMWYFGKAPPKMIETYDPAAAAIQQVDGDGEEMKTLH